MAGPRPAGPGWLWLALAGFGWLWLAPGRLARRVPRYSIQRAAVQSGGAPGGLLWRAGGGARSHGRLVRRRFALPLLYAERARGSAGGMMGGAAPRAAVRASTRRVSRAAGGAGGGLGSVRGSRQRDARGSGAVARGRSLTRRDACAAGGSLTPTRRDAAAFNGRGVVARYVGSFHGQCVKKREPIPIRPILQERLELRTW